MAKRRGRGELRAIRRETAEYLTQNQLYQTLRQIAEAVAHYPGVRDSFVATNLERLTILERQVTAQVRLGRRIERRYAHRTSVLRFVRKLRTASAQPVESVAFPAPLYGQGEVHPVRYVTVYMRSLVYGGPEEGGWWYDVVEPLASHSVRDAAHAASVAYPLRHQFGSDRRPRKLHEVNAEGVVEVHYESKRLEVARRTNVPQRYE